MPRTRTRPLFTIRRIANRNPRLPRIYRAAQQKVWRLAMVFFLAVAGIASLFFFQGQLESTNLNSRLDARFFQADSTALLGSGFETITGFGGTAYNTGVAAKGLNFSSGGIGVINAALYNIKDYFKYIAGSIAILYLIVSALQIIVSMKKEGIDKGKKNLYWSVFALVIIFAIDTMVTAFFEGGGGAPGQSLFSVSALGIPVERISLFQNIAYYFQINARVIFSYLQTLAGAFAILFIFLAGAQMVMAGG
ncbi:MAG: pilin, partial [Patescibacteria group bacterium]